MFENLDNVEVDEIAFKQTKLKSLQDELVDLNNSLLELEKKCKSYKTRSRITLSNNTDSNFNEKYQEFLKYYTQYETVFKKAKQLGLVNISLEKLHEQMYIVNELVEVPNLDEATLNVERNTLHKKMINEMMKEGEKTLPEIMKGGEKPVKQQIKEREDAKAALRGIVTDQVNLTFEQEFQKSINSRYHEGWPKVIEEGKIYYKYRWENSKRITDYRVLSKQGGIIEGTITTKELLSSQLYGDKCFHDLEKDSVVPPSIGSEHFIQEVLVKRNVIKTWEDCPYHPDLQAEMDKLEAQLAPELERQRIAFEEAKQEVFERKEIFKLTALFTCFTLIIPVITGIIYLIVKEMDKKRIHEMGEEKNQTHMEYLNAKKALEEKEDKACNANQSFYLHNRYIHTLFKSYKKQMEYEKKAIEDAVDEDRIRARADLV